jgi:hypothetical protein
MLVDILGPLNIYRPGDVEKYYVEKVADVDDKGEFSFPIEVLKGLLRLQFDNAISPQYTAAVHLGDKIMAQRPTARDDSEKRQTIAFLMVALSRVKVPQTNEPLLPKGLERTQVVCGMFEFAVAAANYVRTLPVLEGRILAAIEAEREGYLVERDKVFSRAGGFREDHAAEVARIKKVVDEIEFTRTRQKLLEAQYERYEKEYKARLVVLDEVTKKLVDARRDTAKRLQELREAQAKIFNAQVQLSDAAERNFRLEAQIRQAEAKLLPKGGKQ